MKEAPTLSGVAGMDREALIALKIEQHSSFGDAILREDLFGHTYLWNVGHAAHIVTTSERQTQMLVLADFGITEELCRQWRPDLDEEKAMSLDLTVPQIVATLEDRTIILCCWWRLFKALRTAVTELPAYWLNAEDAEGCLVYHLAPESTESPEGEES
jgi:hypothetical protein